MIRTISGSKALFMQASTAPKTFVARVRAEFSGRPFFTMRDLLIFLGKRGLKSGLSPSYARLLVHNLSVKGELFRISRGVYTFHPEAQLAGFAFQPFYYGLQDALSLRNLWEQETNPVVLTPRNVRPGTRQFLGNNYLVRRIPRELFYGFETIKYGDYWIPVSTPEKTLVDYAYYDQPLSPEALSEIKSVLRPEVLEDYLERVPEKLAERVRKLAGLTMKGKTSAKKTGPPKNHGPKKKRIRSNN